MNNFLWKLLCKLLKSPYTWFLIVVKWKHKLRLRQLCKTIIKITSRFLYSSSIFMWYHLHGIHSICQAALGVLWSENIILYLSWKPCFHIENQVRPTGVEVQTLPTITCIYHIHFCHASEYSLLRSNLDIIRSKVRATPQAISPVSIY